eukprot:6723840-Lingulodinium_polyedra.AAC.1
MLAAGCCVAAVSWLFSDAPLPRDGCLVACVAIGRCCVPASWLSCDCFMTVGMLFDCCPNA